MGQRQCPCVMGHVLLERSLPSTSKTGLPGIQRWDLPLGRKSFPGTTRTRRVQERQSPCATGHVLLERSLLPGIVAGLSRAQPGQEGGTSRHQIWPETGLRAGTQAVHARHQSSKTKQLRHPAAACARNDRRQSREVRAVGRGRAQCDGLSENGCAPARKPCLGRWTRPAEWWDVACGCSPPICSILRQDGRVLTIKIYLKICGGPDRNLCFGQTRASVGSLSVTVGRVSQIASSSNKGRMCQRSLCMRWSSLNDPRVR